MQCGQEDLRKNFQLIDINKDIGLDIPFALNLSTSATISLYSPLFWDNPTFGGAVSVDVKCIKPPCGKKKPSLPSPPSPPSQPSPPSPPQKGLPIPVIIGISVGVIATILILILFFDINT